MSWLLCLHKTWSSYLSICDLGREVILKASINNKAGEFISIYVSLTCKTIKERLVNVWRKVCISNCKRLKTLENPLFPTSIKSSLLPRLECFESSLLPRPDCFESTHHCKCDGFSLFNYYYKTLKVIITYVVSFGTKIHTAWKLAVNWSTVDIRRCAFTSVANSWV